MLHKQVIVFLVFFVVSCHCGLCFDPSPAFPVPEWTKSSFTFDSEALKSLEAKLKKLLKQPTYDVSSASIELTTASETIWSYHHTARQQDETRWSGRDVGGDSQYRIASITKAFTVLAILQQHKAGNLSINDPVDKYIPEFRDKNAIPPWKDITIRALASQLSGLAREFGQSDFLNAKDSPDTLGLPPASHDTLPPCFRGVNRTVCTTEELIAYANTYEPLFAPNQQSTYSNLNYELLGVVIENVSGRKFNDYIEDAIFKPLKMPQSSLSKPSDEYAVIPNIKNYWDEDIGSLSPTGGIYSSSSDLSSFLRYVLTHYNALVTGVNWLLPASFSGDVDSFYGMPWEIFRTNKILKNTKRPVTFVTKGGGVPAYFSTIAVLPEYGLGITILVAGQFELLEELLELVTTEIVRAAESTIWSSIEHKYSGTYLARNETLNSTVVLETTPVRGIHLTQWISNSTDVLQLLGTRMATGLEGRPWHMQLVPTLLYKNETTQQGEIFRVLFTPERSPDVPEKIWDSFCSTNVDAPGTYAGLPMNEFVFWHEKHELELPAWRVTMGRAHYDAFDGRVSEQKPLK